VVANSRTICVVDDDDAVRDSVQVLLESYGHAVRTFARAEEFLRGRGPAKPACLILDLHMPGMGGLELLERLRAEGDTVPIIVITGRADAGLRRRVERAEAVAMLEKPVDDELLVETVAKICNGRLT
jgi:two-component system response regulator FixJ